MYNNTKRDFVNLTDSGKGQVSDEISHSFYQQKMCPSLAAALSVGSRGRCHGLPGRAFRPTLIGPDIIRRCDDPFQLSTEAPPRPFSDRLRILMTSPPLSFFLPGLLVRERNRENGEERMLRLPRKYFENSADVTWLLMIHPLRVVLEHFRDTPVNPVPLRSLPLPKMKTCERDGRE